MIGLAIGSFLNVLIDRLPQEESITGRSHCDYCKKDLAWYDLLPILSYVYLGARCRYCGKKVSFFYPLVEAITGLAFVFTIARIGPTSSLDKLGTSLGVKEIGAVGGALLTLHFGVLQLLAMLGIVSCAIVIFFSDLKYQIIPDSIQIAFFAFSFLFLVTKGVTAKVFFDQVIAAFVIMLPILVLFLLTKARGMGFGDVKLAFNIGFLLGIFGGLGALYTGFITGAAVGVILILIGKKKLKSKIAFGPFLVLGFLAMLFFEIPVFQWLKKNFMP